MGLKDNNNDVSEIYQKKNESTEVQMID